MEEYAEKRIRSLEEFIRQSTDRTTPDAVSAHSFYSYRHANRLFTLLKGESINSYSNKVRLQTAAEYLKYSSKSILEIALLIGYESSAAFGKAFKKLYGQSPYDFRQLNKMSKIAGPEGSQELCYCVLFLEESKVDARKVEIPSDLTWEDVYSGAKTAYHQLKEPSGQFILLWDEDPEISALSHSRFFLGVEGHKPRNSSDYHCLTIEGRYALFDTTIFEHHSYENWHTLAHLTLDVEGRNFREAPYIEWFAATSLEGRDHFLPDKIAIAIE